jgi:class 3 adenylate cyclase
MSYDSQKDWMEGKKRIHEILNLKNDIEERDKVPTEGEFNFDNGYYSWVTAVFVDIRNSTELFTENRKTTTAKVIRAFMSEIIEILKDNPNRREIGIRGDCVYAIYTNSTKKEDYFIAEKIFKIHTFMMMFNEILKGYNIKPIRIGIGASTAKELVVKTGRKGSGINNLVWIGKAVSYASQLSNIANKNGDNVINLTSTFYENIVELLEKAKLNKGIKFKFSFKNSPQLGKYYTGCGKINAFDDWIQGGMKNG